MAISNPKVNIQILPALQTEQDEDQRILFLGQKTSSGTATAGTLVQSIGNEREEDTLFGVDSMLAAMVRAAKLENKISRMDAIVLDDSGSGVPAAGAIVFSGPATAAGTLYVTIGSTLNHKYTIAVANGDTATDIGDALVAAITADTRAPVSAINTTGSVAVTAVNDGPAGNDITLKVDGTIAGVSYTITAMVNGANDPSLTTVFALVDGFRYQTVVYPFSYLSQSVAVSFLNDRWNPSGDKILDGVGISCDTDTLSNFIASTTADNSQNFCLIANQLVSVSNKYEGSALLELNYVIASQLAAIRALRLTEDAPLANYVSATVGVIDGSKDAWGGMHMATFPYHNTPFAYLPVIDKKHMWTDSERDSLKAAHWTVIGNNRTYSAIISDSVLTRYETNGAGDPDDSYKYLNYVDQSSVVREYFHNNLRETFEQTRLSEGDLVPGYNMANEGVIRAEIMKLYGELADMALVPSGEDARKYFLSKLVVTISEIEGKVTITMIDPAITQLRQIDATMQLTFTLN